MTEREIEMTTYDNDEWNPMSLIKAEIKIPLEEWSFDTEPHMRTLIPLRYLEFIPPSGSKTTWKKQQTLIPLFLILQRPLLEDHSYNSTLLTGNSWLHSDASSQSILCDCTNILFVLDAARVFGNITEVIIYSRFSSSHSHSGNQTRCD